MNNNKIPKEAIPFVASFIATTSTSIDNSKKFYKFTEDESLVTILNFVIINFTCYTFTKQT